MSSALFLSLPAWAYIALLIGAAIYALAYVFAVGVFVGIDSKRPDSKLRKLWAKLRGIKPTPDNTDIDLRFDTDAETTPASSSSS